MSEPHSSTTSGLLTYGLGAIAALVSRMGLNDYLILFSLILVILRIWYETSEFFQRKADRKIRVKKR